ncbi:MAG TPA: pitrilysin family protein [Pyrinomonadaceae bacterium]|jgi:predicted Zn-dependent peptidase
MNRIFLLLVFLALPACTTWAQSSPGSGGSPEGQLKNRRVSFESYKLANGLRVLLAPDEAESGVAVNISFDAGSRRENPEQAGLAGLLQNILLQTLPQTRGEKTVPVEGVLNQERASYYSEAPAGQLDSALSTLARLLLAPDVNQTDIDAQLLAIRNGCGKLDESRFGRAQETLLELIYSDSAFKYGAACSRPGPNHLSPERVKAFFSTYYVPNNAVLVVVGNFKAGDAKKIVGGHFGAAPRRPAPPKAEFDRRRSSLERRKVINGSRAGAATYLSAYLTVPSNHPDWYALNILADIIGQGETSRLYTALVARKLAASVPEGVAESRGQSLFRVGAALSAGVGVEKVEAIIDAEISRIRSEGVTPAEMDRAGLQERQYSAEQLGTALGRASFLARATLYYDDPNRINTELDRILAVTANDVRRVARKYLVKTNRAVVIVQPAT